MSGLVVALETYGLAAVISFIVAGLIVLIRKAVQLGPKPKG
jgi:hypothetical protein